MDFVKRRILTYVFVVIGVANLDFILPRIAPGNASELLTTGNNAAQQIALLKARFGLDQSIYTQYYLFLKNTFATWPPNFGISYEYYPESVTNLFASRIGWTLLLILMSLLLSILISYIMAAFSSMKRGGKLEVAFLNMSIAFQFVPVYWTAMILLWVFAVILNWFPIFGNVDAGITPSSGVNYVGSIIWHAVLPVAAMTASIFGENYLVLRSSAQEILKSDYVLAAKLRGLRGRVLATSYVVRNSLLPLVAVLSFSLAGLVSRAVLVEAVFGYNGIGDLIVDAVTHRDYPVLEGTLFLLTVIVVLGGIIGDQVLIRLDPKLRK